MFKFKKKPSAESIDEDPIPIVMTESTPIARNSFVPSILPEWKNQCKIDEDRVEEPRTIQLTDENAANYAGITSYVGWRRRVEYALDFLEKDSDLDASLLACLLESVISTVITLASGETPPDNYLISTSLYLRYVRNEFGQNPPNIAAFLEYLKSQSSREVRSALKSIADHDVEEMHPNLIITQIPKALQEKLYN